jgi:small-conductance mechanosensitive channel
MLKKFLYFIIIVGLLAPFCLLAQKLENPLGDKTFSELIDAIAVIVMKIGAVAAVIFIIWSGFLFITARGSEEQLKKAKATFTWTIIGTAVLLGASVITRAVVEFFQGL